MKKNKTENELKDIGSFDFKDHLSQTQKIILKISVFIGFIMFFVGVQITVRNKGEIGNWLSGIGIFIAAQMFWGIKKIYNWLEKKKPQIINKYGYKKLFWIILIIAYIIDFFGIMFIFTTVIPNAVTLLQKSFR